MSTSHSSDDEGAPEELGLQAGKAAVFEEQARQSESRQQLRAVQKQRRQDQAALDQQRAENRSGKRKKLSESTAGTAASTQEPLASLPDSVIEALLAKRSAPQQSQQQQLQQQPYSAALQRPRRRQKLMTRRAGPVTVEVLEPSKTPAASDAAIKFAASRFQKHSRSSHMLLPPAALGSRALTPASNFASKRAARQYRS